MRIFNILKRQVNGPLSKRGGRKLVYSEKKKLTTSPKNRFHILVVKIHSPNQESPSSNIGDKFASRSERGGSKSKSSTLNYWLSLTFTQSRQTTRQSMETPWYTLHQPLPHTSPPLLFGPDKLNSKTLPPKLWNNLRDSIRKVESSGTS